MDNLEHKIVQSNYFFYNGLKCDKTAKSKKQDRDLNWISESEHFTNCD